MIAQNVKVFLKPNKMKFLIFIVIIFFWIYSLFFRNVRLS
jgi:hypothetical protein